MSQPISIEKTAKTVDEAVRAVLDELQVETKDVEIHVLEEASKGFFGLIGVRPARVRVTLKPDASRDAIRFLRNVFATMDIQAEMQIEWREKNLQINFTGSELGVLIGRRGDTLDALQYLTNLVTNRSLNEHVRIVLDVENYRQRREETLIRLAKRLADKAKRTSTRVTLEPMSPQERRIIHTTLQNDDRVSTHSEGEDPYRKVVIIPKSEIRRPRNDERVPSKFPPRNDRTEGRASRIEAKPDRGDVKSERNDGKTERNEIKADRNDGKADRGQIKSDYRHQVRPYGNRERHELNEIEYKSDEKQIIESEPLPDQRDFNRLGGFRGNSDFLSSRSYSPSKISRGATPLGKGYNDTATEDVPQKDE